MNNKILQNPYERFKKRFKKGEQICIYGTDWSTHGYISNIESDGVTLTQLRNLKGIKYPWNCFEVIAHAGYKITKSKNTEVEDIFEFKLSTHLTVDKIPTVIKSVEINKLVEKKTLLFYMTNINFKAKEISRDIKYKDRFIIDFKVGDGRDWTEYNYEYPSWKIPQLYPNQNNNVISPALRIENKFHSFAHYKKPDYYCKIHPEDEKELQNLRKKKVKWEKKTESIAVGDPVIFEGIPVDYKTWESKDGFVMANHHADIYI